MLLFTIHNTKNIAYHVTEVLTFYANKLMVMGISKNLLVFNFASLPKSQKFDAREIYMFYSIPVSILQTVHCCFQLRKNSQNRLTVDEVIAKSLTPRFLRHRVHIQLTVLPSR